MADFNLYPDFQPTPDNCGREPIHRPLGIQNGTFMLAVDEEQPDLLLAMSENLPGLLGIETNAMWQQPLSEWLPDQVLSYLREIRGSTNHDFMAPRILTFGEKLYELTGHSYDGRIILELEPGSPIPSALSSIGAVRRISEAVMNTSNPGSLPSVFCQHLKHILGYDRVMLYQFDHENHGLVIGEACESGMSPFLGLKYPSTDIPRNARRMFLRKRSRIIFDATQTPARMLFRPDQDKDQRPLDMTLAQARATSPIHLEYLANMGVGASLTISIISNKKLWGLIACHHRTERRIPVEWRKTCEILSNIFSERRAFLEQQSLAQRQARNNQELSGYLAKIGLKRELGEQILEIKYDFSRLCQADGCAFLWGNKMYSIGTCPGSDQIKHLRDWLEANHPRELFVSDDFQREQPEDERPADYEGGLAAIRFKEEDPYWIFWFRKPEKVLINWAGNPYKASTSEPANQAEPGRLSPRKSFQQWQEIVKNQSTPWSQEEIRFLVQIQDLLQKKAFHRSSNRLGRLKTEFEQMTYAASHDLLEPLRTIKNYLQLIEEEFLPPDEENLMFYLRRINLSIKRMEEQIRDIFDYSRVGSGQRHEKVDLSLVLEEVTQDLTTAIQKSGALISADPLPFIKEGDKVEFRQLFQNLLSNAIKFMEPGLSPEITITVKTLDQEVHIGFSDNGIGIEEQYIPRIFQLFQRLHIKEQYPGTGIGLSLVRKIALSYDGRILVTSTPGEGSTFTIVLPESRITYD